MRIHHFRARAAFTLVELLMVIAIIGVLVAIIVPTVMYAARSVKTRAISIEVQGLSQAIEAYKSKYGDYPPDGSNAQVFQRHFRKLFPQIAATEFTILDSVANAVNGAPTGVMDPAEALVFALGGFSKDAVHPFTGPGGPISAVPGTSPVTYQYNVDRNEPLYDFKQAQLTIDVAGSATLSTDEVNYSYGAVDALPVYRQTSSSQAPFVYFDSRTYSYVATVGGSTGTFFNNYGPGSGAIGFARPYKSDKTNTNTTLAANPDAYYRYMNEKSFQLLAAGLDDSFGGVMMSSGAAGPVVYRFPTGESIDYSVSPPSVGTYTRYKSADPVNYQLDNSANFADGPLSDSLAN